MPELPEVETVRRDLEPHLPGRTIAAATAEEHPRFVSARLAAGRRIEDVGRRGKYLLLRLDDSTELVVHLGMTGVLSLGEAPTEPTPKHLRARWILDDGRSLELVDPRKFGRVELVEAGQYALLPTLDTLGPEPLSEGFTPEVLRRGLERSGGDVKTKLLSQRVVAGIGNIYADEALWKARIHPGRRTLTGPEVRRLHGALIEALESGILRRGTTLRDYRGGFGQMGENQHNLKCYGRAGEPCERCATLLAFTRLAGRGTTFCPRCQKVEKGRGGVAGATPPRRRG